MKGDQSERLEKNKKFGNSYVLIAILLAVVIVVVDRLSEHTVSYFVENTVGTIKITSFFNLVWTKNDGISFGMLQGLAYGQWLLSFLGVIITGFFFIWLLKVQSLRVACALGLIIGGGLGNVIERIIYGHVIDIFDFHIAGYHWPAFNINDSAIFIGVVLLIFIEFLRKPTHKNKGI